VDTPETVDPRKPVEYFGKEAAEFTRSQLEGKQVRLEYDWQRTDKYGRTLAYVYQEDGSLFNAKIIAVGYAHAYTKYPFKQELMDLFRTFERDARENRRGLWKEDTSETPTMITSPPIESDTQTTVSKKEEAKTKYWINTSSGVRHNSHCRWYGKTREGHFTTDKSEGKACGICGG
jgi:micrococcal nuclease